MGGRGRQAGGAGGAGGAGWGVWGWVGGVAGGASNLYNIISIHSEKNVGWILHEDNGPNHPMIHLNVKCGYIL